MKVLGYIRFILAIGLFGMFSVLIFKTALRSQIHQHRKYDDANINHMKYGLFNVNAWKEKMSTIIVAEIEEFKINKSNKSDLKKHVEGQLNTLIDKLNQQIEEDNKNSTKGWIKKKLIKAFVDVNQIKGKVPEYADTIVAEMTHEESQKKLKDVIKGHIGKYLDETFEPQDMAEVNAIVYRSGQKNQKEAMRFLADTVPVETASLFSATWTVIALAIGIFLLCFHPKNIPVPSFLLCMSTLLLLLYAGVTCPMIDMVARISNFSFMLFGHKVEFTNQIVYFQSKSIIDVFWILMDDPDIQMKFVGVLMILFSIVFPVVKILSSFLYYFDVGGSRDKWLTRFFVLKSGKWSMTDVQVVAILMAYIGFNGMVSTQFDVIRKTIPQFNLISTNDTTLQIGFYIFFCYVVLAMLLSLMIEKTVFHARTF